MAGLYILFGNYESYVSQHLQSSNIFTGNGLDQQRYLLVKFLVHMLVVFLPLESGFSRKT